MKSFRFLKLISTKRKVEKRELIIRSDIDILLCCNDKYDLDGYILISDINKLYIGKDSRDFVKCEYEINPYLPHLCLSVYYGNEFKFSTFPLIALDKETFNDFFINLSNQIKLYKSLTIQQKSLRFLRREFIQLYSTINKGTVAFRFKDIVTMLSVLNLQCTILQYKHIKNLLFSSKMSLINFCGEDENFNNKVAFTFEDFCYIYHYLVFESPIYHQYLSPYINDDDKISIDNYNKFLQETQQESTVSNQKFKDIFGNYSEEDGQDKGKNLKHISKLTFMQYLFDQANSLLDPICKTVNQDMTKPLSHYWINSSHNTYLTGDQISSESSPDAYVAALSLANNNCRCVELDCWDGLPLFMDSVLQLSSTTSIGESSSETNECNISTLKSSSSTQQLSSLLGYTKKQLLNKLPLLKKNANSLKERATPSATKLTRNPSSSIHTSHQLSRIQLLTDTVDRFNLAEEFDGALSWQTFPVPIIYHGLTLTTKISLIDTLLAIKRTAFAHSEFPVILSIEDHCSLLQMKLMAALFKQVLGDSLLMVPVSNVKTANMVLPSPEQLKRKFIIKHAKLPENEKDEKLAVMTREESFESHLSSIVKHGILYLKSGHFNIHNWTPYYFVLTAQKLYFTSDLHCMLSKINSFSLHKNDTSNNNNPLYMSNANRSNHTGDIFINNNNNNKNNKNNKNNNNNNNNDDNNDNNDKEDWIFKSLANPRKDAEKILKIFGTELGEGCYIVRNSGIFPGDYTLSFRWQDTVEHCRIRQKYLPPTQHNPKSATIRRILEASPSASTSEGRNGKILPNSLLKSSENGTEHVECSENNKFVNTKNSSVAYYLSHSLLHFPDLKALTDHYTKHVFRSKKYKMLLGKLIQPQDIPNNLSKYPELNVLLTNPQSLKDAKKCSGNTDKPKESTKQQRLINTKNAISDENLEDLSYYFGEMKQSNAEALFDAVDIDGSFLLRRSSSGNQDTPYLYTISFRIDGITKHCRIKTSQLLQGIKTDTNHHEINHRTLDLNLPNSFAPTSTSYTVCDKTFDKLSDLVDHYKTHPFYKTHVLATPLPKELTKTLKLSFSNASCPSKSISTRDSNYMLTNLYVDPITFSSNVIVQAQFEYKAQRADELSFSKYDIIVNVNICEKNWWKGDLRGKKQHWFPANHARKIANYKTLTMNSQSGDPDEEEKQLFETLYEMALNGCYINMDLSLTEFQEKLTVNGTAPHVLHNNPNDENVQISSDSPTHVTDGRILNDPKIHTSLYQIELITKASKCHLSTAKAPNSFDLNKCNSGTMQNSSNPSVRLQIATSSENEINQWIRHIRTTVDGLNAQEIAGFKTETRLNIAKEMSDLVVYCKPVPFNLNRKGKLIEMSSLSELKAEKYITPMFENACHQEKTQTSSIQNKNSLDANGLNSDKNGCNLKYKAPFTPNSNIIKPRHVKFAAYHNNQLMRIYPKGQRMDSSNYDPTPFWIFGCQMVALNFQTPDKSIQINHGFFSRNGHCGYVLKPDFMLQDSYDPYCPNNPAYKPITMNLTIIAGYHLKRPNKKSKGIFSKSRRLPNLLGGRSKENGGSLQTNKYISINGHHAKISQCDSTTQSQMDVDDEYNSTTQNNKKYINSTNESSLQLPSQFPSNLNLESSAKSLICCPYVEIEIIGPPYDCYKAKTSICDDNGLNPIWNETFGAIHIQNPDLCLLRFAVYHSDDFADAHLIAQNVLPLGSGGSLIRNGIRSVPLKNAFNYDLDLSTLLVYMDQKPHFAIP